jgi:NitT/TauT family transport system permease protein/sulfonate transport system permease protein
MSEPTTAPVRDVPAGPPLGEGGGLQVLRVPGQVERDRAGYARRRRVIDNVLRWGTPVVILALWQVASVSGMVDRQFWPAPLDVIGKFWQTLTSGLLPANLWATVERLLIGYISGAVIGIALGLVLGTVRPVRTAIEPVISALYTVPKLAIYPLMLLLFGIGDTPKIILTALGVFYITCLSTLTAVISITPAMHEPMRSFQATPMQTFRHLTLPAALPDIFVALRLGAGMSVLVLIGIEMIQGADGLGWLIWSSWQVFDTERMYVGILVAAVFGVAFQESVKFLGRVLVPWMDRDSQIGA